MNEETKKRLVEMPQEKRQERFETLRKKLGIAAPESIAGGKTPLEASLDEHEEYQFLKDLKLKEGE